MRIFLSLTLALSISAFQLCNAATGMDVTASSQLRLLELKYFEHTFDNEPTEDRVERIEKLVRGEVGEGNPQDRIKSIASSLIADGESLAPSTADDPNSQLHASDRKPAGKYKQESPATDSSANSSTYSSSASGNDTGSYPKVTNLEREILKQTFEGQPLQIRLARLETRAFGSVTNSMDFGGRTDKLEDYAESALHDKPFAVNPDIDKPYVIPAARQSFPTGGGNSLAAAEQAAMQHFFGPSRNMSTNYSSADQSSETAMAPLEDPEVYQKTPPPDNARMVTRVGWCEMQTFGHTFPQMHLTKRLRQLNDEVRPNAPKQNDMQLMDDLDPIMQAVILRKSSQNAISSGNNSPVH